MTSVDTKLQALNILLGNVQRDVSTVVASISELRQDFQQRQEELKPCPFCKSKGKYLGVCADNLNQWFVHCGYCGGEGPHEEKMEPARHSWNHR